MIPFGLKIAIINRAFRKKLDEKASDMGLTSVQLRVLGSISRLEAAGETEIHQNDLERLEHITHPAMTKHIQKLEDVIAVCRACHEVIHIGRTALLGREPQAQAHFMKVNGCTQSEYHAALGEANRIHAERSRHEWVTDITKLRSRDLF